VYFFFQINIYLRAFSLKMTEMAFLFSGWCQTVCSWMHVIFLIFADVGLYNVNRRSICVLKHPDVPFISFKKCLLIRWTVFVLRNAMKFSSIYIYIWMGSQCGRKWNSSICVYRTSCLLYQTCWESILFLCEICGQMVTLVRPLLLNLMHVIWTNTWF
jgi:hypothetical protein